MRRCIHVMRDEKIINRTIKFFEKVYPSENKYIVIQSSGVKYVQPQDNVVFISSASGLIDFLEEISSYKYLIIHFLWKDVAIALRNVRNENICWIEWGADLYNQLLHIRGYKLYSNQETEAVANSLVCSSSLFSSLTNTIRLKYNQYVLTRFIKKVKYFIPDSTPDEYSLLLKYYPEFSFLKYKEIFYYPINDILGNLLDERCSGTNIIVNHSASPTGNHIDVFRLLSRLSIHDRKIVVPISYGTEKMKRHILDWGQRILNNNFCPVLDFMSLDEYNKLLLTSNIFIYGHIRQEAVGNILIALYIGGKVFLSSESPMYLYYKRIGLRLYSLNELDNDSIKIPMKTEDVEINRRILRELYSTDRLCNLIKQNFE